ncbi:MAG TPA: hypothetical protein PLH57_05925, partial [Oligoflexia bacterium]|nr:hypothetical protein [Oligoflexia bacterium]
ALLINGPERVFLEAIRSGQSVKFKARPGFARDAQQIHGYILGASRSMFLRDLEVIVQEDMGPFQTLGVRSFKVKHIDFDSIELVTPETPTLDSQEESLLRLLKSSLGVDAAPVWILIKNPKVTPVMGPVFLTNDYYAHQPVHVVGVRRSASGQTYMVDVLVNKGDKSWTDSLDFRTIDTIGTRIQKTNSAK